MKIEQTSRKKNFGFIAITLVELFFMVLAATIFSIFNKSEATAEDINPNSRNFIATSGLDIEQLIDDEMYLYNDKDVSVFALVEGGVSKLAFVYKEEPLKKC